MDNKVMMAFCALCGERFEVRKVGEVGAHVCAPEPQILNATPAIPQSSAGG